MKKLSLLSILLGLTVCNAFNSNIDSSSASSPSEKHHFLFQPSPHKPTTKSRDSSNRGSAQHPNPESVSYASDPPSIASDDSSSSDSSSSPSDITSTAPSTTQTTSPSDVPSALPTLSPNPLPTISPASGLSPIPFVPSDNHTSYIDHGSCGPRGDDAREDMSDCVNGYYLVYAEYLNDYQIVATVDGCNYFEYEIFACNESSAPPTITSSAAPTTTLTISPASGLSPTGNILVKYYSPLPSYASLPSDGFDSLEPYKSDTVATIDFTTNNGMSFATSGLTNWFGALFEGYIICDGCGGTELCLYSDDGSKLYVDNDLLIDHDGLHGPDEAKCASYTLNGVHKVDVQFFDGGGGALLALYWKRPTDPSRSVIPAYAWVSASTVAPTVAPTVALSVAPTITSSAAPTITLSAAPTTTLSAAPTITLSAAPTTTLSVAPTITSSAAPTITSTVAPTVTSSAAPTFAPTATPSTISTLKPSTPNDATTIAPTVAPTSMPSINPTLKPSSNCLDNTLIYVDNFGCLPSTDRNGNTMVYVHNDATGSWDYHEGIAKSCGGHLASIVDSNEEAKVNEYYPNNNFIWIGGEQKSPCANGPSGCWDWIDGSLFTYTNWGEGEPNDYGGYDETCMDAIFTEDVVGWNDDNCNKSLGAIYILPPSFNEESECLFDNPIPSQTPTLKPSRYPSSVSSSNPSSKPSTDPSSKPSRSPSSKPSRTPTSRPSMIPTSKPSINPTLESSIDPTLDPSINPTLEPSINPTLEPTINLTIEPSINLSSKPSITPVIHPSTLPSAKPSPNPTSKLCPPYMSDTVLPGCGGDKINETISPSSGANVGGTVIKITNIKYCLTPGVEVYCRFKNDNYVEVAPGTRVGKAAIECVTPQSGGASSTQVSYAVFSPGCIFDPKVRWNNVDEIFEYSGDLAGVVLSSDFGGDDNPRLISAGKEYIAKWSSNTMFLSVSPSLISNLEITLELLAYSKDENPRTRLNENPTFSMIYSKPISQKDFDSTKFEVSDEAIAPAMNTYSTGIKRVAFVLVRIVAFTPATKSKPRRIHATKTSKLIGMLPKNTDTRLFADSCPVRPLESCEQEDLPPCPPTYQIAENDFTFSSDESCIWPSGEGTCAAASDLDLDLYETCLTSLNRGDYEKYCGGIDPDKDVAENCDCKYFHPGAVGCVKKGNTQCCYSASGGLITDPRDGGGTRDCSSGGFLEVFLYDVLPYMYCCKLNDECESYHAERPSISDEGYVSPQLPVYTFGDPHLESFDNEKFDFNGYGEFIAFCGRLSSENVANNINNCQPNSDQVLKGRDTTSVHYRFATLEDNQNGTVTVGVAIEDPTYRNGLHALTVVRHPEKRLEVYDGSDKVKFPGGRKNKRRKKRKIISGTLIQMTPVIEDDDFNVLISLKSGMLVRVRETVGVLTVGFVRRPAGTEKYVGLLGIPDDDITNDFTAANGTVLNVTTYPSVTEKYEGIFRNVGQTWMVPYKNSSLFKELGANNDFDIYNFPDYSPNFTSFEPDPGCVPEVCGSFTGFLRESCCFDYIVTNNTRVVGKIMEEAVKEETIRDILNNTVPRIEGGNNRSVSVEMGENTTFIFRAYDEDGDNITIGLDRNDRSLFEISVDAPGLFRLSFAGTQDHNTYKAQASIADGKGSTLFTASVYVAPPPCVNDRSFRYNGSKKKSCVWVGEDESRRQRLCSERDRIRIACRMTCGLCCKDDPNYTYTTRKGFVRDCEWTGKNRRRTTKYCKRKKVRSYCPITCQNCQNKYNCANDNSFRLDGVNGNKSCIWIGKNEARRLQYCPQSNVRRNCPTTCGLCCENDRNFLFQTELNTLKSCAWIAKKISRINKYCPRSRIKTSCAGKRTCNSCKSFVEPDL